VSRGLQQGKAGKRGNGPLYLIYFPPFFTFPWEIFLYFFTLVSNSWISFYCATTASHHHEPLPKYQRRISEEQECPSYFPILRILPPYLYISTPSSFTHVMYTLEMQLECITRIWFLLPENNKAYRTKTTSSSINTKKTYKTKPSNFFCFILTYFISSPSHTLYIRKKESKRISIKLQLNLPIGTFSSVKLNFFKYRTRKRKKLCGDLESFSLSYSHDFEEFQVDLGTSIPEKK